MDVLRVVHTYEAPDGTRKATFTGCIQCGAPMVSTLGRCSNQECNGTPDDSRLVLRVVCAAIHHMGKTYYMARPARHHNLIEAMGLISLRPMTNEQGFLLSNGEFATRKHAAMVAFRAGQVKEMPVRVFTSEELW